MEFDYWGWGIALFALAESIWWPEHSWKFNALFAALDAGIAVWHLADSEMQWVLWAAAAAILAHRAWQHRPPRNRKPSRVLARIRELGGKLTVSPA